MTASTVVIGANYGDEGKGLITDFETRRLKAGLVSRFNGGAQAGHTVVDGDLRHVFGHHGSGTFAGADTHLGSRFIVNPFILQRERQALQRMGFDTTVRCERALVTTIFDMILNGLGEISRGRQAHGSCGLGINETVTRSLAAPELSIEVQWAHSAGHIRNQLARIQSEWVPRRLEELGITPNIRKIPEADRLFAVLEQDIEEHCHAMIDTDIRFYPVHRASGPMVFEGAQGLMLDEFLGEFPHVTRSMTGLPYAIQAAAELGVHELQPVYVTRSYLTRHGNGPLENEGRLSVKVDDSTNVPNRWQGELRFAPLNLPKLEWHIKRDLERAQHIAQMFNVELKPATIAVTWLDVAEKINVIFDTHGIGTMAATVEDQVLVKDLPTIIEDELGLRVSHVAHGPENSDVQFLG